jgi:hypothetical protein
MKLRPIRTSLLALTAIAFAGSAFAAQTTTFTMLGYPSGVQGPVMGGVYTSPYYAQVGNGGVIPVICDDFVDNTYFSESWTAYVTQLSAIPLSGTISSPNYTNGTIPPSLTPNLNQAQAYTTAAYLALEILRTDQSTTTGQQAAGDLSYAMWGLFDPAIFTQQNGTTCSLQNGEGCLSAGDYTNAMNDLTTAWSYVNANNLNPTNFLAAEGLNSVTIYSYDVNAGAPTCSGGPCPSAPPQEFIAVSVPEPSLLANLAVDFAGLLGLFLVGRRFRVTKG